MRKTSLELSEAAINLDGNNGESSSSNSPNKKNQQFKEKKGSHNNYSILGYLCDKMGI